ncbi:MAG: glycoside hydrolase family 3 protein [Clostridiales bacterium]|nr:glycoside hydrolase family 3 protein [Clostridiales bacterium]
MKKKTISLLLVCSLMSAGLFSSCQMPKKHVETTPSDLPRPITSTESIETEPPEETLPPYHCVNPKFEGLSAVEICSLLTLEEKASQMIQGANYVMPLDDMQVNCYGSVLSHYSVWPATSQTEWLEITSRYQDAALLSNTRIPYIYANDCVHGVNEASGSVIFPHNINVGAANDEALAFEMGMLTGSDMIHCGFLWSFSPCVASAQDPRWGRTYESYSSDETIVTSMAVSYARGLMSQGIMVCPKHFVADGYTLYGTGEDGRLIDRGDAQPTDEELARCMAVYKALVDEGVPSIMISHSALNGIKMHENKDVITYLRQDLGFQGLILSDWESIHNCSGASLKDNVILSVNAGVDMFMEEKDYLIVRDYIIEAVNEGSISMERIDEAVTRIIQFKLDSGIFEDPFFENRTSSYEWNSDHAHEVARELAAKSMVPLVLPEDGAITLTEGMKVFVCGPAADDSGVLCGGWTYVWQGGTDEEIGSEHWCAEGPTILEALTEAASQIGFEIVTDEAEMKNCDVTILCLGEYPYAEWEGDTEDLSITGELGLAGNKAAIDLVKDSKNPVITLIVAGRNVLIDEYVEDWDEVVMCYLPGSEGGNAVADLLTGKVEFYGRLPMPYYSSLEQIGTDECWLPIGFSAANKPVDADGVVPTKEPED